MTWTEAIETLTDNMLAAIVVIPAIVFVYMGIEVPEWHVTAVGAVLAYYFTRQS